MSVFECFKELYLYIKKNRALKEEHWHYHKSSSTVYFGHKHHNLDIFVSVYGDKMTYFMSEEGNKKLTNDERQWFFELLEKENLDHLFIKTDADTKVSFTECIATGPKSEKMKRLYDELIKYKSPQYPIEHRTALLGFPIKNKSHLVTVEFEWDKEGITLKDTKRRLNRLFRTEQEIQEYAEKFKATH